MQKPSFDPEVGQITICMKYQNKRKMLEEIKMFNLTAGRLDYYHFFPSRDASRLRILLLAEVEKAMEGRWRLCTAIMSSGIKTKCQPFNSIEI